MELIIDRVLSENSGQYVCDAINGFGGQRTEVTIKVLSAPKVVIRPSRLTLVENSKAFVECTIENNEHNEKCWISWIVDGRVHENVMKFLKSKRLCLT